MPTVDAIGPAGLRTLKPRHKLIALMSASGRSNAQIAIELGMSSGGVGTLLKSPLMRALVDQYVREIETRTASTMADVLTRVRDEAGKTLDTILEIRDNGTKEDSTRLSAAVELFDRQMPKVHKTDESRSVRIVIDGAAVRRLGSVVAEAKGLPPVAEDAVVTVASVPRAVVVRALDEAIHDYAMAESDDDE